MLLGLATTVVLALGILELDVSGSWTWGSGSICIGQVCTVARGYDTRCDAGFVNVTYTYFNGKDAITRLELNRTAASAPDFVFTHIPKAGGTSVVRALHERAAALCTAPVCLVPTRRRQPRTRHRQSQL